MYILAKKGRCNAVLRCQGPLTAAYSTPLCAGRKLGRRAGDTGMEAVMLGGRSGRFVCAEFSFAQKDHEMFERHQKKVEKAGVKERKTELPKVWKADKRNEL